MTTASKARPHRPSEGTSSAQQINAMPHPLLLDTSHLQDSRAVMVAGSVEQRATRKPHAPLRLIKPAPASAVCGFGTCALDPECTGRCRYHETDEVLHSHYRSRNTQRADIPHGNRSKVDHRLRAITWRVLISFFAIYVAAVAAWLTL